MWNEPNMAMSLRYNHIAYNLGKIKTIDSLITERDLFG